MVTKTLMLAAAGFSATASVARAAATLFGRKDGKASWRQAHGDGRGGRPGTEPAGSAAGDRRTEGTQARNLSHAETRRRAGADALTLLVREAYDEAFGEKPGRGATAIAADAEAAAAAPSPDDDEAAQAERRWLAEYARRAHGEGRRGAAEDDVAAAAADVCLVTGYVEIERAVEAHGRASAPNAEG